MDTKNGFHADQVRARALMVLSRRGDLTVIETKNDTGLDLHVYIEREDREMRLMFGVLLRGVAVATTQKAAHVVLKPTVNQFTGMGKFLYPVCLLFFTKRDEQEFFAWLAEPVIDSTGPKLIHHTTANCLPISDVVLNDMVERIVAWYDAVLPLMVA